MNYRISGPWGPGVVVGCDDPEMVIALIEAGKRSAYIDPEPPKDYVTALVRISNQDAMLRNLRERLQAKEEELLQWQGSVKPQSPG